MTPERLGKYEIRGTLGKGAMGLVYDGWDKLIMRRVAIKTVSLAQGDEADVAEGMERFRREAQAAGRLQHPNIVSVYDFGETESLEYIVMEFMDGGTLKEVLDRDHKLPPQRACDIMCQVLAALAYSHARGVIHRDVKPANIMLDSFGSVKLGDFGIARIDSSSMTLVGDVLGTPAYMAPEQFLGDTADARSDIFAAGATLFHLVTGSRPHEGSRSSVRQKVLTAVAAPSASDRAPGVPAALDAALQRAMARQPGDRFQTASDFADAVRTALLAPGDGIGDETVFLRAGDVDRTQITHVRPAAADAPAMAKPGQTRGRLGVVLVSTVLILAVAACVLWYVTRQPAIPRRAAPAAYIRPPPVTRVQTPVPVQPLPPKTPPLPDPAEAAAAADAAALLRVDCALAHVQAVDGGLRVTGVSRDGAARNELVRVVSQAAGGLHVDWQVQYFTNDYCLAIATIRDAWLSNTAWISLQAQKDKFSAPAGTVIYDGDHIKPMAGKLNFAAHLRIDDVEANGKVVHFYPRAATREGNVRYPADVSTTLPPGGTLLVGVYPHTTFAAGPPYGKDLFIVTASSSQLLTADRPAEEAAGSYLRDLQRAIDAARSAGAHVAAGAMTVETARR